MMGHFGSEQWQYIKDKNSMDWKNILQRNGKKKWWECWARLALFPIKVLAWIMAMFIASFISIIFILPGIVAHYSWQRLRQEVHEIVQEFKK